MTVREIPDQPTVGRDMELLPVPIEGVVYQRITVHADHRGSLMPTYDPSQPVWGEDPIVWAYTVTIRPGRIKGWGMHKLQADRYAVISADMRVALYDGREDSPSHGRVHVVDFTRLTPGLLRIPPGVWHADHNWGDADGLLINFPTAKYDPERPDKHRIDPYSGEIPFDFTLRDY